MKYNTMPFFVFMTFLSGCDCSGQLPQYDQKVRREALKECLESVPRGPDTVVSNDWDEVVKVCNSASADISRLHPTQLREPVEALQ